MPAKLKKLMGRKFKIQANSIKTTEAINEKTIGLEIKSVGEKISVNFISDSLIIV